MNKETLFNKVLPMAIILTSVILAFFFLSKIETKNQIAKPNWEGLVKLGLAPDMQPRIPTSLDEDTGVRFSTTSGQVYAMLQSGDFKTIGKTFLVRVK